MANSGAYFANREGTPAITQGTPDRPRWSGRRIMAWGGTAMWNQVYNALGNAALSTVAAAIPVVTVLVLIAAGKVKAHIAAVVALVDGNILGIFIYAMAAAWL